MVSQGSGVAKIGGSSTLVERVLVLLALLAATGHAVELVHEAAALLLVVGLLLVVAAAGNLVDEIHGGVLGGFEGSLWVLGYTVDERETDGIQNVVMEEGKVGDGRVGI